MVYGQGRENDRAIKWSPRVLALRLLAMVEISQRRGAAYEADSASAGISGLRLGWRIDLRKRASSYFEHTKNWARCGMFMIWVSRTAVLLALLACAVLIREGG